MEMNRSKTSSVWRFFEVQDATVAICSICKCKLSYKSSISNLKKHLQRKHPMVEMNQSKRIKVRSPSQTRSATQVVSDCVPSTSSTQNEVPITPSSSNEVNTEPVHPKKWFQEKISPFFPKKCPSLHRKK